jgi:hypothetical protein
MAAGGERLMKHIEYETEWGTIRARVEIPCLTIHSVEILEEGSENFTPMHEIYLQDDEIFAIQLLALETETNL